MEMIDRILDKSSKLRLRVLLARLSVQPESSPAAQEDQAAGPEYNRYYGSDNTCENHSVGERAERCGEVRWFHVPELGQGPCGQDDCINGCRGPHPCHASGSPLQG